jgi:hypothetical protein
MTVNRLRLEAGGGPIRPLQARITLPELIKWIKQRELEPHLTKKLIRRASNYPSSLLNHFKNNFNIHLNKARKSG